jgi:hypothetical protein
MGNCTCINANNKVMNLTEEEKEALRKKEEDEIKRCINGHVVKIHMECPEGFEERKLPCQTCKKKIDVKKGFFECEFGDCDCFYHSLAEDEKCIAKA